MTNCAPGCKCKRHRKTSWETRQKISDALRDHEVTEETKAKLRLARLHQKHAPCSQEQRALLSKIKTGRPAPLGSGRFNFSGGKSGEEYAKVLCPVGFVREYRVYYSRVPKARYYQLDFAHVEAKVAIELDGPFHYSTNEDDRKRDVVLRSLGWKVIRIKDEIHE